jgi:sulfoxide reductase heme-binding subunit YedZ
MSPASETTAADPVAPPPSSTRQSPGSTEPPGTRRLQGESPGGVVPSSRYRWRTTVRIFGHVAALIPGLLLIWDTATGGLSYDPVRDLTQRTGRYAFMLLTLSLAISPLVTLTGLRVVSPLSRIFGLYAFAYATAHLLMFVGLDFGFRLDLIVGGVLEKRFAVIGLTAFLILAVLAFTSTKGQMRRLGALWKRIHKLVYVAAGLATLHYLWAVKTVTREHLIWMAAMAALLALRIPEVSALLARVGRGRPPSDAM